MTHKSFILLSVAWMIVSLSIQPVHAQDADFSDDAAFRGKIVDISPKQRPITGVTVKIVNSATGKEYIVTTDKDGVYEKKGLPAGRYTISASKEGYGDRFGKSKVVAAGGEVFYRIKMKKKDNIVLYFLRRVFTWQLVVGFAAGFLFALIINSGRSRV